MYDLVIIGGGPAGVSAGIYAARKKIKTVVITDSFGGQSAVSRNIYNWIGTKSISGWELAKSLEEHLRSQEGIEILEDKVSEIIRNNGEFLVKTASGKETETKTILICAGGKHRLLNVAGEEKFIGKGVVFCATCDAPLFKGKEVAVVGSGNAGLEAVIELIPYASKIYLIEFKSEVKGDPTTYEDVLRSGKTEVILNAKIKEILGNNLLTGLKYEDINSGEEKELTIEGVFVEIGMTPNSDMVKDLVDLNDKGEIVIDYSTGKTSLKGIWAAGDITDSDYKQNNIAAGDAARAVLDIYSYLQKRK
ncbi:MAG: FAD-dependent oxidoreductase [Parcubacteria group bacterium]